MENTSSTEFVTYKDIPPDPITDDLRLALQIINFVIISDALSLFGIWANIVNIVVFVKQGFKDRINISLLGLAISDLACSGTMFYADIFYNPWFYLLDLPLEPFGFGYFTGGWPHVCATRITSVITSFITLERCLCIAMPLKVKNIITSFRTRIIIISSFVSVILLVLPVFCVNYLEWQYNHSRNISILTLAFTKDREIVESVTFFMHSVFLSTVLFLCVVICTIILVVKLNKKTKWRKATVTQTINNPEISSVKDKKVVKMITLISSIYIVCNVPNTAIILTMVFLKDFSQTGKYENMLWAVWSFQFILDALNSSVNIFVYFKMSSKFRVTLIEIFSCLLKKNSDK